MFTKKDIALLQIPLSHTDSKTDNTSNINNVNNINKTIKTLQAKLTKTQSNSTNQILDNFSTLSGAQIKLYKSKQLIHSIQQTNENLHKSFLSTNTQIIKNLNDLTESRNTTLKISNTLIIFKKLYKIYKIIHSEKKERESIFSRVSRINNLSERIKLFKEFDFHDLLLNEVHELRASLLLELKNQCSLFLNQCESKHTELGSLLIDSRNNNKDRESVIFDNRFLLKSKVDFSTILNSLKELGEDFFLFFNTRRSKNLDLLFIKDSVDIKKVMGVLLVEFFLFSKSLKLDLQERYLDILLHTLNGVINQDSKNRNKILKEIVLIQWFTKKYYQRYLLDIDAVISKHLYLVISSYKCETLSSIRQLLELNHIISGLEIREVFEVFNKRIDTSVLSLNKQNIKVEEILGMEISKELKNKVKQSYKNRNKHFINEYISKLENLKFEDYKSFILGIKDTEVRNEVVKHTGLLLKQRINGSNSKKIDYKNKAERDLSICITVLRELNIDTELLDIDL